MNKGVYFPFWSLWMAHKLLFLHHGPDSKHTNHDDSLDFEPDLALAVVTVELPLWSLCGNCNWYNLGNKYIPYAFVWINIFLFFFFKSTLCAFVDHFTQTLAFRQVAGFQHLALGLVVRLLTISWSLPMKNCFCHKTQEQISLFHQQISPLLREAGLQLLLCLQRNFASVC